MKTTIKQLKKIIAEETDVYTIAQRHKQPLIQGLAQYTQDVANNHSDYDEDDFGESWGTWPEGWRDEGEDQINMILNQKGLSIDDIDVDRVVSLAQKHPWLKDINYDIRIALESLKDGGEF